MVLVSGGASFYATFLTSERVGGFLKAGFGDSLSGVLVKSAKFNFGKLADGASCLKKASCFYLLSIFDFINKIN